MNDIEKEIEGELDSKETEESEDKEEDNIKLNLNRNRNDDRKKVIIYVLIGILVLGVIILLGYFIVNRKSTVNSPNDNDASVSGDNSSLDNDINDGEDDTSLESNIGYVSCDDNTSLLNVRNSVTGNIIDGLSCYKEVTIEEELDGNETCNKWYKISYKKRGNNYTGYSCGTYIKKSSVSASVKKSVTDVVSKVLDYYDNSQLKAYCGNTSTSKTIKFDGNMEGEYLKSEYKTLDDLKKYVSSFMDTSLSEIKLELSDIDSPKYYDNYYEIDGELYCRNYAGKGKDSLYTKNYDIEITSVTDSKVSANISYEYLSDKSSCSLDNLANCSNYDYVYELGKITIDKKDGNYIVTKINFPK